MDNDSITDVKEKLSNINQSHLLKFYDQISEREKKALFCEIEELDLEKIPEWVENYIKREDFIKVPSDFEPAPYFPAKAKNSEQQAEYDKAKAAGEELIRAGKVGAFVVAGGQGTRLGFGGPKGNFPTSPIKNKTLFQLFAENILAANKRYSTNIPWYIMTSPLNHNDTIETLKSNHFYGLSENDVFIFQQGTMPNFDFEGRIFLSSKSSIAKSPDGHGGSLKALYKSGAVADMQRRGIEELSYFQVDNPLINIVDPVFIGLHTRAKAQMSSKALIKACAKEKVGNFCIVEGKISVIEYSDLPDEQAEKRNPDGSLAFELGSIAIHIISRNFIEELNCNGFALPFHRAIKKIPHIDEEGNKIIPEDVCGIKLETFVFDALPIAERSIIFETLREEEFAPVKNAQGVDSPEVTRRMMSARAAKWLIKAGLDVPMNEDGSPNCKIEMSSSFALHEEDVKNKLDKVPAIKPGDEIYLD